MAKVKKLVIQPFSITVHYKKMKNVYLRIKPDGNITISAPIGTSKSYLTRFVNERAAWITEKQQKLTERAEEALRIGASQSLLFGKVIDEPLSEAQLGQLLHEKIVGYVHKYWGFFAERGCPVVEIKYRLMKATWGVCRPTKRTITFNKRLVHQPEAFIEYVVLHELCHLLVPNHSKDFYTLVAYHMPRYREYIERRVFYESG
ncbi:MAG: M48 family metallopeptidase [Turicibacter sp.]|nr:M48 family metallopeptidase [Turicibacter sp.]